MCELQCVWGQYTLYWGVCELQYVCVCCGGGGGGNMSTLTILNICAERPCVASPSPLQLRAVTSACKPVALPDAFLQIFPGSVD